jgi:hypothetical protein
MIRDKRTGRLPVHKTEANYASLPGLRENSEYRDQMCRGVG